MCIILLSGSTKVTAKHHRPEQLSMKLRVNRDIRHVDGSLSHTRTSIAVVPPFLAFAIGGPLR